MRACAVLLKWQLALPAAAAPIDISDRYPRSVTSVVHPSVSSGVEYLLFLSFYSLPCATPILRLHVYSGHVTFVVLWKPARGDETFDPLKNSPHLSLARILFLSRRPTDVIRAMQLRLAVYCRKLYLNFNFFFFFNFSRDIRSSLSFSPDYILITIGWVAKISFESPRLTMIAFKVNTLITFSIYETKNWQSMITLCKINDQLLWLL